MFRFRFTQAQHDKEKGNMTRDGNITTQKGKWNARYKALQKAKLDF
ncbi:hypothetical protein [Helicobacter bilis]|nr:hypothetical protein [Helicobacter bilis]